MSKFVLGKSFLNQANGIRRQKIDVFNTPYALVLAYENEFDGAPEDKKHATVCFPYFHDLPKENGFRAVKIGDSVPEYQRESIEKILKDRGYREPIKW